MILKLVKHKEKESQDGGNPLLTEIDNTLFLEGDEIVIHENSRNDEIDPDGKPIIIEGYRIFVRKNKKTEHSLFIENSIARALYDGYLISDQGKTSSKIF